MTTLSLLALAVVGQSAATPAVTRVKTIDHIKTIAVKGAPTGSKFAVSDYSSVVRVMDAKTGSTVFTLSGHPQPAFGLAFTPNGQQLVTGDESGRIWVWDLKNGKKVREFPRTAQTHARGIQALSFSTDGKTMYSTGKDDVVIVWDFATAKPKLRVQGNGVVFSSANMAPGSQMVVGTLTEGLHFRKAPAYGLSAKKDGHGGQGVSDLALNPAGTRAVTAGRDSKVTVWDVAKQTKLGSMVGHLDSVQRVAMAPNGRLAASSANDRMVIVWNTQTYKSVAKLENQCAVGSPLAFTGDGRYLITVNVNDGLQINSVNPPAAAVATKPAPRRRR